LPPSDWAARKVWPTCASTACAEAFFSPITTPPMLTLALIDCLPTSKM